MTTRYARRTMVPVDRSRAEVEKTLARYGCTGFAYAWQQEKAGASSVRIEFLMRDRAVRLVVPMPPDMTHQRQRWRVLVLVLKAKLESVELGLSTLESEFLANIVMNNGTTIGEAMLTRLPEVVKTGRLLPAATEVHHG